LFGEVAAHECLLEGREDFFGEVLNYEGITTKIFWGFSIDFLEGRRGGGCLKQKFNKK
jgi:hypothetical protein